MSDISPGRCIVCKKPLSINASLAAANPLATIMFFCMTPGCSREGLVTMVRDDDPPAQPVQPEVPCHGCEYMPGVLNIKSHAEGCPRKP